jgi:pyridoxal phosphate enzyme (YggS family)
MSEVAARLAGIRAEIGGVQVAGVTKFQPVEKVREAVAAGLKILANNYAQDGEKLMAELGGAAVEWHFIGHIQSRKVKYLTDYALVESLDRLSVAEALSQRATRELSVLVEVNVGGEAQKSGIAPAELEAFLDALGKLPNLKARGLMGMPPPLEPVEARRPFFKELRQLYDRYSKQYGLSTLSMGTSADYKIAVQEGATLVRLGTSLFGERPGK